MESNLSARVERVAKLERHNRRLKLVGVVVSLLAGSLFLMGQTRTDRTVEAAAFLLKDSEGNASTNGRY